MKRPLEFRVWHKPSESMYYMGWNPKPHDSVFMTIDQIFRYGDDGEIMPLVTTYGDLKLFVGDICNLSAEEPIENYNITTDYNWEITMKLVFDSNHLSYWFVDKEGCVITIDELGDIDATIEIIGNVFETPELL